jgi:hypothetical protein
MEELLDVLRALVGRVKALEYQTGMPPRPEVYLPGLVTRERSDPESGVWLKVIGSAGSSSDRYTGEEVYLADDLSTWTTLQGGVVTPDDALREVNGVGGIATDGSVVVRAWPSEGEGDTAWAFEYVPPSAGGAVAVSGARAGNSAATAVASGTSYTTVPLSNPLPAGRTTYDTDAYWASGNPTRLTVPATGYYHIAGLITWDVGAGTSANFGVALLYNGTSGSAQIDVPLATLGTLFPKTHLSLDLSLTAGDYVELAARQTSGGSISIASAGTSWLSVHRIH